MRIWPQAASSSKGLLLITFEHELHESNVFVKPNADKLEIVLRFAIESPLDFLHMLRRENVC